MYTTLFSVLFFIWYEADSECVNDVDCSSEHLCIEGKCINGCNLPGACGINALCQTVLHRTQCSCPTCHSGVPELECKRLLNCEPGHDRPTGRVICSEDKDCASNETCVEHECVDACLASQTSCEPLKKCETRAHKPLCICKFGFYLTAEGELTCAPEQMECLSDQECSKSLTCANGKCQNPCSVNGQSPCEGNKTCAVINHKPICLCLDDCNPSLSVCLRDAGCAPDMVCRNYECVNPCVNVTCPRDTFCAVDNHVPVCKYCAEGYRLDAEEGCVRSKLLISCFPLAGLLYPFCLFFFFFLVKL